MRHEAPSEFARAFSHAVTESMGRLGKLKKELARSCGMRPDRFSHLQAGTRRPSHGEVLRIGQGLRLDEAATNRLLEAAGFPTLKGPIGSAAETGPLADRLGEPEGPIALAEMERDLRLVRRAWEHYVGVQERNQARDWAQASDRHQAGMEVYWELRAMAARFLAQVNLAASSADPHLNRMAEAEARCEEGMEAAAAAGSRAFQVMLLTRLASIKRLRSDYEAAGHLYDRALAVIDEWKGVDGDPARGHWRAHWTARIQRMQGMVELFKGRPTEALRKLEPSLEHFKDGERWDELCQACYGLGWAHGLRGDYEAAASWDSQGLEHARLQNQVTRREDDRSLLQGHLYLGGDHLDLGDLRNARSHLEEAGRLAAHSRLRQYHEVGRVDLLLSKLELREGNLERAHEAARSALAFFAGQQEQTLLAQAHNVMGEVYQARGGTHLQRALDQYARALQAARACRPANAYYECAALVNICRARIRAGLPAAELASEGWRDVDALLGEARELGRTHRYLNHRARLAALEAEWALKRGDDAAAQRSAMAALHLANNFSPLFLREIRAELVKMGLQGPRP